MPKHIQPSVESLQQETEALLKELETPETPPKEEKPAEAVPPQGEEVKTEEVKKEETPQKQETPKEEEKKPEQQATPSPDYKKKFSESSKEAQKIVAKNRKLNQAIDEANEISEPTEEELKVEYPDFEVLDDTQKKIAKDSLMANRRFALISKARAEAKKIEKWDEEVDKFVGDPRSLVDHPELEGKVDEFKLFAAQEANANIPFSHLVGSFLYEKSKKAPQKHTGKMFPDGSGGTNEKGKPKGEKISIEESEILRKTNYDEYKRLLVAGKISTEI